jgi:hypothetical protein
LASPRPPFGCASAQHQIDGEFPPQPNVSSLYIKKKRKKEEKFHVENNTRLPTMGPYKYQPVSDPNKRTRVFTLAPGAPTDPLTGTIEEMDTEHPVAFEALSYCWGWNTDQDIILCDGGELRIRANLGIALRRLRHKDKDRVLWIDQVCINQQDLVERSEQVKHMSLLYEKTTNVLVWLGKDPSGHAPLAFELLRRLAAIEVDQFKEMQPHVPADGLSESSWTSLSELFKVDWASLI